MQKSNVTLSHHVLVPCSKNGRCTLGRIHVKTNLKKAAEIVLLLMTKEANYDRHGSKVEDEKERRPIRRCSSQTAFIHVVTRRLIGHQV